MQVYVWVLQLLLSVFFVVAGSIKVFGWQKFIYQTQLAFFQSYGFNRSMMLTVGIIELAAAIGLWWPHAMVAQLSALAIAAVSAGAIVCHLRFDSARNAIAAIVTLVLSTTVLSASAFGNLSGGF
ncbi:DoxX family protein [Shewanella waksmanii]|uniref:DoxX family protein n=1 Tax=Shewanella waksmanii TaxID=213783 RepID=UPI003735A86C